MIDFLKFKLTHNTSEFRYMYFGIILTVFVFLMYRFIKDLIKEIKKEDTLKVKLIRLLKNNNLIAIIVTILPMLFEIVLYRNYKIAFYKESYIRIIFTYLFCLLVYIYKILEKRTTKVNEILDFVVKHRYKIALIIFVILVLLKVNFSSLGMWDLYIREGVTSTPFGQSRAIRSDEWLVTTPFNLSQHYNGFKLVNDNLALGNNDMNIFHGPVLDASIFVRVFSWGYMLFGNEMGISWAWCLKLIVMFMVYFELGMMITKKDKGLSLMAAVWLTFSPAIMWWSMWDTPAFAVAIIVLFHAYVSNKDLSIKKKLLIAYGMVVFLCNFAYSLYPAWQVPLAYLILSFIIVDFIKYRKNLNKKDYLIMGITLLITALLMVYFVITSWNGIHALMSTKYPGAREVLGGDYDFSRLTNYYTNFFTAYTDIYQNPSEISSFIYPTMSILVIIGYAIITTFKNKNIKETLKNRENWYIYGVIVVLSVFLLWMVFSWPRILRKITLMYNSPTKRTETIFEFACVILTLLLSYKVFNKKNKIFDNKIALGISVIITVITYFIVKHSAYGETYNAFKMLVILSSIFIMNYTLLSSNKKGFIYTMIIMSLLAGGYVNPITIGTAAVHKTEVAQTARKIASEDPEAIWAGESQVNAQYLIANGLKVLNGINEYPNYDWINILDSDHEKEEVWNRYAHIIIVLGDETNFELMTPDSYVLTLTYDDLKKLNIKYFYANRSLYEDKLDKFRLKALYKNDDTEQYIYQIQ